MVAWGYSAINSLRLVLKFKWLNLNLNDICGWIRACHLDTDHWLKWRTVLRSVSTGRYRPDRLQQGRYHPPRATYSNAGRTGSTSASTGGTGHAADATDSGADGNITHWNQPCGGTVQYISINWTPKCTILFRGEGNYEKACGDLVFFCIAWHWVRLLLVKIGTPPQGLHFRPRVLIWPVSSYQLHGYRLMDGLTGSWSSWAQIRAQQQSPATVPTSNLPCPIAWWRPAAGAA
jgi:hypothetical protein